MDVPPPAPRFCKNNVFECEGPSCPSNHVCCDKCSEEHDENPSPDCLCDQCEVKRAFLDVDA